jgi:hypothetical protein
MDKTPTQMDLVDFITVMWLWGLTKFFVILIAPVIRSDEGWRLGGELSGSPPMKGAACFG